MPRRHLLSLHELLGAKVVLFYVNEVKMRFLLTNRDPRSENCILPTGTNWTFYFVSFVVKS